MFSNNDFTSTKQLATFPILGIVPLLLNGSVRAIELLVTTKVSVPLLYSWGYRAMLIIDMVYQHQSWVGLFSVDSSQSSNSKLVKVPRVSDCSYSALSWHLYQFLSPWCFQGSANSVKEGAKTKSQSLWRSAEMSLDMAWLLCLWIHSSYGCFIRSV